MSHKLFSYVELVRLPNVFTALADVAMGFFVTREIVQLASLAASSWVSLLLLGAASACLYLAGMALNDVFDADIDREERPERPIPSGRVSLSGARGLGFGLLASGVAIATFLSIGQEDYRPAFVALGLAASIVAYDWKLKRLPIGPFAMGLCRFLNVLLGMSLSTAPWEAWNYVVAAGIGLYIAGVTWFARTEARASNRLSLLLAMVVGGVGVGLLVYFPRLAPSVGYVAVIDDDPRMWHTLWMLLGALIAWRCLWAIADPRPLLVQRAVRQCIFSLVMLDAAVTFPLAGFGPAVFVILLLIPSMFLGMFLAST